MILLVLMSFSASAEIYHEAEANTDYMDVNTTIQIECEEGEGSCPVNQWQMTYQLPEDSEVEKVEDTLGEIDDYDVRRNEIEITSNQGEQRNEEYFTIQYRINSEAEEVQEGLYTRSVSFSSFEEQQTRGEIKVDDLISGRTSYGFENAYSDRLQFEGEGPVEIRFNFGEPDEETTYYKFFTDRGTEKVDNSESGYEIALGTVGHQQDFEKFPVAVYSEEYSDQGFEWSAGEYQSGYIRVRNSTQMKPILTHETIHGLNDKLLRWDRTNSKWFDEGVAEHGEDLVRTKLYKTEQTNHRTGELFGETVTHTDIEEGITYRTPPRGDRDHLWEYYQTDRDFMKDWSPHQEENRDFGYAYSELVIKKYLLEGGDLHTLYSEVEPDEPVQDNEEKWSLYSEHMNLTPCDYESRAEFEDCLDEINKHEFEIKTAQPTSDQTELEIDRIETPDREPDNPELEGFLQRADHVIETAIDEIRRLNEEYSANDILEIINEIITYIVGFVATLWKNSSFRT